MVPDRFNSTNDLMQRFIKENGAVNYRTFKSQASLAPEGHCIDSGVEVQRLRRELIEKEKLIEEVEARETHLKPIDCNITWNMDELKAKV